MNYVVVPIGLSYYVVREGDAVEGSPQFDNEEVAQFLLLLLTSNS